MNSISRIFKNEIRELIALRRDPLYHSIGKLVWGKYWYVYVVMIVLLSQSSLYLRGLVSHLYSFLPSSYGYFVVLFLSLFIGVIPLLSAVLFWGYLPFKKHNAKQVIEDLKQTPIRPCSLYEIFVMHTLSAYLLVYILQQILIGVRVFLFWGGGGISVWKYFAPFSYEMALNPDAYEGFFPLTFYRVVLCPLADILPHFFEYLSSAFVPVCSVLLLMAFWKSKGLFCVIRRLFYVMIIPWGFGMSYSFVVYAIIIFCGVNQLDDIQGPMLVSFKVFLSIICLAILWFLVRLVRGIMPFSGEDGEFDSVD